ncbi:family 16 glycoside hydrolase [Tuwongella immobilis]|uniref:3-keto-alpha-glucoside-1,2-lyase/3-keto-2-hydroxy-glucal hydratase domain-containing protein n=1 Tax=Tuwongella immobilis TaxID=692036 RepID=A0A6C2YVB3_9BACT|nr:family 16 glycoside hydrolase [Tuwongella immobilis]VIP05550.1 FG-GAP repeat protein OS=Singulisphaera acidiphila (strain ATCC BAA-1392 / DSM 18658 / VKM B-2454 / MOB10) GN=Sinac_4960 PE=4 SV=1: FG-GAP: VCBS: DUF1080 [Tuwongella immobilis]VTS08456.1 FG-GAP repeat protein OS=Singulisphaera acidiphila (strain ATCC BAA-1392 / DSM 18658 / VKM B-2454 / MOB10) GN=Sinac_4960 PE=4 SV=1: FG-GAP: VCBS: DUF1080 [Tuwongella immobilis]
MSACRGLPLGLLLLLPATLLAADAKPTTVGWKRTVIDPVFRSEGVAVGDVNKDGKIDIITGDYWYEAPSWTPHEIRKPGNFGNGAGGYSQSFACWADDVNGDGWVDAIVVGFPGEPVRWYENPKGSPNHWTPHEIWHSACNETPLYVDLFGTGKRVLLMGWQPKGKENEGQMAWFRAGADPKQLWEMHPVSEPSKPGNVIPGTFKYAHGLGAVDVNGDGRADVVIPQGWWEQPEKDTGTPWKWHPAPLGEPASDIYTMDLDGDGKLDVVSSSAHSFGIWSFLQKPVDAQGNPAFVRRDLFPRFVSQTHAMHFVDINGDGLKDLVTGKRWWAHGPRGDLEPNAPAALYWFEASKVDGMIRFTPRMIDIHSGVGTQFSVADVNGDGKLDVITSNKRGVYLHEQTILGSPTLSWKDASAAAGFRPLFNEVDLSGWDTYIGKPADATAPIGLNKDPQGIIKIVAVDGEPAIRIAGGTDGALATQPEFENYHLRLQFKWGQEKSGPRAKNLRDSGLLYHSSGEFGAIGGVWMKSFQFQVQESDVGDFFGLSAGSADVAGELTNGKPPLRYTPGAKVVTVPSKETGGRVVKRTNAEKPLGEWNTLELIAVGDQAIHVVNGEVVMVVNRIRNTVNGKDVPVTRGRIQLQAENAEMFFRRLEIKTIAGIPAEFSSKR